MPFSGQVSKVAYKHDLCEHIELKERYPPTILKIKETKKNIKVSD